MKMMDHPNIIKLYESFEDIRTGRRYSDGVWASFAHAVDISWQQRPLSNSHLRCSNIKMQVVISQPLIQNKTPKEPMEFLDITLPILPGEVLYALTLKSLPAAEIFTSSWSFVPVGSSLTGSSNPGIFPRPTVTTPDNNSVPVFAVSLVTGTSCNSHAADYSQHT